MTGTTLAGKYRLVSLLGRGGMGSVYRAERMGWQAPVAIKLMNPEDAHDPVRLARFQREACLAASLRSIHVVQVLDDGVDATTGAPFIVMELLEGETLAERLSRVKRLRPPVVAQIITQIARALARAHDAGLIHRDLKPDNILIVRNDDEELLKVLDFGIAKWLASQSSGTLAGQMLGTPVYMSPEHFGSSASLDHKADLWSLGVIAYECMTGVRPFEGDTLVSLALSVCSGKFVLPSNLARVPDGFDAWFARAVARDPAERFPSARIMAEELRGLCGQMPMLWEPEAPLPKEHSTGEKTELEPVLPLTRRARGPSPGKSGYVITDADSVLPMLRTPSPPAERKVRRWLSAAAVLIGVVSFMLAAVPQLRPTPLVDATARLWDATSALRGRAMQAEATTSDLASSPAAASGDGAIVAATHPAGAVPLRPPASLSSASGAAPLLPDAGADAGSHASRRASE